MFLARSWLEEKHQFNTESNSVAKARLAEGHIQLGNTDFGGGVTFRPGSKFAKKREVTFKKSTSKIVGFFHYSDQKRIYFPLIKRFSLSHC